MKKKILLVDDSPTALMISAIILGERTPHQLITAKDGDEAIATAIAECPDLILMDVVMPKKSGFQACEQLRKDPRTAEIPIILLTTRGEAECVETGFISGCTEYLTKPVNADDLVQVVGAYLAS